MIDFFSHNLHHWILQSVAMAITTIFVPKLRITGISGPFLAVLAIAFVNTKFWDAALFFEIPNALNQRTLLLLLANGFLFWVVVKVVPGIEIDGFWPAMIAPVIFTVCSYFVNEYADLVNWSEVFKWFVALLENIREYFHGGSSIKQDVSLLLRQFNVANL